VDEDTASLAPPRNGNSRNAEQSGTDKHFRSDDIVKELFDPTAIG